MPTWNAINAEIDAIGTPNAADQVRQKYLAALAEYIGRPVIAYYSGFLQKKAPDGRFHPEVAITDHDLNGFMAVIHDLDRSKGVDIILHTPGGDIEATRAIVEYLYKMFGRKLNAIVPQIAMSAGTMIACATNKIWMAKHSCLGPTDPHINGLPAMGILAEVDRAIQEIRAEPLKQIIWQQVFSKYPPAFILNCERSVEGSRSMVKTWLQHGMFRDYNYSEVVAEDTIKQLMNYGGTSGHNHHFLADKCKEMGLNICDIETDQNYQEAVLSVHHSFMASFSRTKAIKIVENSIGATWVVGA